MKKFVFAGAPAIALGCALFASAAWPQEDAAASTTTQENSEPAKETQTTSGEGTSLPGVVVTADTTKKKAKKQKSSGPSQGGGDSADTSSGDASAQDTGGVAGTLDSAIAVDGVTLGGPAIADTGTSVFDSRNVRMRSDGGGDANSFLRNLPNVQYQNDTNENAGVNLQQTIDTRPALLSINGARTYENNFILNGVSISTITGPVEPFPTNGLNNDTDPTPNLNAMYGLHPQTVFVPSEFIGTATLIDSNASAEYGEFQGGVVLYDLAKPPTDRYRASVAYDRHTDDMVHYRLATPTRTNPLGRLAPTFEKENLAASVGAPITNELSFIAQASRKTAETTKQKEYKFYNGFVDEESENTFLRFATALKTGIGRFTFDTSMTDYVQNWQSPGWRDLEMDVETQSSTKQIEYFGALPAIAVSAIGLDNVTLKTRAYYNNSDTGNYTNSDVAYAWVGKRRRKVNGQWVETFTSDRFEDWCRSNPVESLSPDPRVTQDNTICYEGGYGNKEQGQTDTGVQAQFKGNVFLGNFLIGGEAKSIEGRRARLADFVNYSSFVTATGNSNPNSPAGGKFNCLPDDKVCLSDMYARIKTVAPAFDIEETVNAVHGFAELNQTLGWFNVRAGVRVDYEDYFENVNVAPRLVGTVTPIPGISFTGGYNRYYLGETLYYALRDSQPFAQAYTRSHTSNGTVLDFPPTTPPSRQYTFKSSDLDTPFHEEYTGAVRVKDPLLGGQWRLRYLERYGRDQFSSTDCGSNCTELTNDGESFYRSATAEYTKFWRDLSVPALSGVGITVGATWSEQTISRSTYFDDESLTYIYYKGRSYTPQSFSAVTGNLDIPIRIGGTLSTNWLNDRLWVDFSAGYNLGYEGVYDTGEEVEFEGREHLVYDDMKFKPVLMLDLSAQLAVTEQAAISLKVDNILDTGGNSIATNNNPWVRGRSYWVGSTVRF
ncbi:hypothetical protein [Hyphomicrobium sp.]|uniref:hypothetical protein n=1 Tax=Hyphomicrobium sp. TaxID=82 RepID=UPI002E31FF6B|nr:hypothetical protein [Hyphomicrobium sp.]HEX2842520.1 hypothetical protein [Hyphomicrobium sp.]